MRDNGIGSWPTRRARADPEHRAMCYGSITLTYAQLEARVAQASETLRSLGVDRGDRVAMLADNHADSLVLLFATARLGAIYVAMNMRLAADEVVYQLSDCGATVLVYDEPHSGVALDAGRRANTPQIWELSALGDTFAEHPAGVIDNPVGLDDPALIMYTSGTTGAPKGVVLSHGNLVFNAMNVLIEMDFTSDEIGLITTPLFHAAALNMNALPLILKGATLVIAQSPNPEELLSLISSHGVTHMQGVPTIHQAVVDSPSWQRIGGSTLRQVVSGGAAAPLALIQTFLDAGIKFCQGYGMTETGPGALFLPPQSSARKPGSVGRAMFFTDVRIADAEGNPVSFGEAGEVLVSGPNVMARYWNQPAATAAAFHDGGWYRSGDVARVDPDGDAYIVDRIKDMYVSGGENVYPAEVEKVLAEHPAVAESAVIGVADERWGEVGRAIVVTRAGFTVTEQELLDHARSHLARYKAPKSVLFVDALPRNATGKIAKPLLRQAAADDRAAASHPISEPIERGL